MKHLYPLLLFSFFLLSAHGQNLVPNPSFEEYSECPTSAGEINLAYDWFQSNNSNPDLFSSCGDAGFVGVPSNFMGQEPALYGVSYANICTYYELQGQSYREYIGVRLTEPLLSGTKYFLSLVISLSDSSRYSTNSIGAYFSEDSITDSGFEVISTPQQIDLGNSFNVANKLGWQQAFASFIATGDEEFMTIGNFRSDSESGVQMLNDGGSPSNLNFVSSHYYIDYVCLSDDSLECLFFNSVSNSEPASILVYPNPADEIMLIEGLQGNQLIRLLDAQGRLVLEQRTDNRHQFTVLTRSLPSGFYHLVTDEFYSSVIINH